MCHLGDILASLGPSWARLGPSWGYLGGILVPSWATLGHPGGMEMLFSSRRNAHFRNLSVLGFCLAVLGVLGGILGHLEGVLGGSWVILGYFGAIWVASWGHLGAILGQLGVLAGRSWAPKVMLPSGRNVLFHNLGFFLIILGAETRQRSPILARFPFPC